MNSNSEHQRFLRRSLLANAVFSVLSGLVFALGYSAVSSIIGLAPSWILLVVGVGLLGFAGSIAWLASRAVISVPAAMTVVWCDLGWVVGTVPLVLLGVLNATGNIVAGAVAGVVLAFGLLQYVGVRRVRRQVATP